MVQWFGSQGMFSRWHQNSGLPVLLLKLMSIKRPYAFKLMNFQTRGSFWTLHCCHFDCHHKGHRGGILTIVSQWYIEMEMKILSLNDMYAVKHSRHPVYGITFYIPNLFNWM